ncbi:MAG TPA: non-homologous end-joining DNA ligase [Sphingobacterium sp.]|nr:non-homologous end-joining DNA ligase [Sphingobacterium sp.]
MKIGGIEISNPDKILFPKNKITKLQVLKYYESIADKILPFLKNRPLTLHRFPNGINAEGFYQKKASDYFPPFIKTLKIKTKTEEIDQVYCTTKKSLIYLVNQGTIEFHIWLAKKDNLYKPDKVIFDLDPSDGLFKKVIEAALIIKEYLNKKNISPYVMTTGQSGLHIGYNIRRTKTFDSVREEVKEMGKELVKEHPFLFTLEMQKKDREGKIFIDYLRNAYGQTSVCPYSLRANKEAGIATPILWKNIDKLKAGNAYQLANKLKNN